MFDLGRMVVLGIVDLVGSQVYTWHTSNFILSCNSGLTDQASVLSYFCMTPYGLSYFSGVC